MSPVVIPPPRAGYSRSADGNFYGVAPVGGMYGDGTVFSVSTNGALTTLDSFNSTNGATPDGGLAQGSDGNFYGTTLLGGKYSVGTVFSVSTNGTLATVVSLTGLNAYPFGGLVQGADGKILRHVVHTCRNSNDFGTVFSVMTNGTLSTLVSFDFYSTGGNPTATLVQGADGSCTGTTSAGGPIFGTTLLQRNVWRRHRFWHHNQRRVHNVARISQGTNGLASQVGLILGADGNFYGTAPFGGVGFNGYFGSGDGVIFRIGATPPQSRPVVIAQPVSQSVPANGSLNFSVNASGAAPLNYTWQRNGTPIAGATQSRYTADRVLLADSGEPVQLRPSATPMVRSPSSNADLTVVRAIRAHYSVFNGASDGGYSMRRADPGF